MNDDLAPLLVRRSLTFARTCGIALVVIGAAVVLGWAFEMPALTRILPSLPSMKVNMALAFIVLGAGIITALGARPRRATRALAAGLMVFAGVIALQYVFGVDLGIDELLFRDPASPRYPGRPAPAALAAVLLCGQSLLLIDHQRWSKLTQAASLAAGLVALLAVMGYAFGASSLYALGPHTSMALHTAVGLVVASVALLAARPTRGLAARFLSDTGGGVVVRRMVPFALVVAPTIGWLSLEGRAAGLYDTPFGVAILVTSNVVMLIAFTFWVSGSIRRAERALRQRADEVRRSDGRKTSVVSSAFDAIVWMDHEGAIVEFNPAAERMFGHRRGDVLGRAVADVLVPPELRDAHRRGLAHHLATGQGPMLGQIVEREALRADGSKFPAEIALVRVAGEDPPLFSASIRDISARARAAEQFRLAIDAAPTGMIVVDMEGVVILVNSSIERILGWPRDELLGQPIELLVPPHIRPVHEGYRRRFALAAEARIMGAGRDLRCLHKDGREIPVEIGLTPMATPDGARVLVSIIDISGRVAAAREREDHLASLQALNASLEQRVLDRTRALEVSLREKDVLLREIHHRVKNNLQVISSLLNLQSLSSDDLGLRRALGESRDRIQSLALVHDQLYRADNPAIIELEGYLHELVRSIDRTLGQGTRIRIVVDAIACNIPLDQAVPCGLIVNELVTNAVKHAFPGGREGTITISAAPVSEDELVLAVRDNGVGLPAAVELGKGGGLGMLIVDTLVQQLAATLRVERTGGAGFELRIPRSPLP